MKSVKLNDRVKVDSHYWRRWNKNYQAPQVGTVRHLYPLMVEFDDMPNVLVEVDVKLLRKVNK